MARLETDGEDHGERQRLDRMETRINAMEAMIESLKALKPATTAVYACSPTRRKDEALLDGACRLM